MEKRIGYRSMGKLFAAAAACGLAGVAANQADASLVIDIRATAINGAALNAQSTSKDVRVAPGDTVTFGVFAQTSGANGQNDEAFQGVLGVFRSNGSLLGDLVSHTTAGFTGNGAQQGSQVDVDSDGDLDIGIGPNTPTANGNTVFQARSNSLEQSGTILDANSEEFEIGSLTFAIKPGALDGQSASIDFFNRKNPNGTNQLSYATWAEDAVTSPPGNKNPTNGLVSGNSSVVTVGVPEPTGLALAGIAGLGLLARRRKNA